jgi:hypothetical protein
MRYRSNFFPIALIVIGTIFLLVNLGVIPSAEIRALLAKWWPLILIVVGLARLAAPRREPR